MVRQPSWWVKVQVMHGLINRSLENFICRAYGTELWQDIVTEADLGFDTFEGMFIYDDELTQAIIDGAVRRLDKSQEEFLEDFGTFLIADPENDRVRRLLRFGGVDYSDFLQSLDELRGRVRLALPCLDMPELELRELGSGEFTLTCTAPQVGFGHVLLGVLRAMADDYGALVFLEYLGRLGNTDTLSIRLLDEAFSEGREFSLVREAG